MRIVNAMFGCRLGGLEQVFLDYGDALDRAGHEVHALIHPRAAIRAALEQRGTSYRAIGNVNAWDAVAVVRLRRWLGRVRPDATIAHGNRAAGLLRGAAGGTFVGVAPNYQLKPAGLAAILCSTEDLRRHFHRRGVAADRLFLVPNAVRVPSAVPERVWHDPPVIGAMGRFVAKKGFEVLVDALRLLADAGTRFRGVIAGDGAEGPALRQRAHQAGLGRHLDFPGWETDKARFFDRIDVFCLPSHHEPFGVVLLEAMAQGLPVVATASEGPSEILAGGDGGIIVPRADPAALAEAIARVLRDREAARRSGRAAYQIVRATYDLPLLGTRLDHVLREIAGSGAAERDFAAGQ